MNDSTSTHESSNVQQPTVVPFHGHDLITVKDGDTVRVAMRPIVDAIGLQWEAQLKRIKRHPVLSQGVSIMDIPSEGGIQQFTTLPLRQLNGWLFGISANRAKPEIREKLIEYQLECFDALADYWQLGVAINPRTGLTPEHQHGLQKAVRQRAMQVPEPMRRKAFSTLWTHLKDRFGVAKYDQIDDSRYTEALGAVQSFSLEGDWLEAEREPNAPAFTDEDLSDLYILLCHVDRICRKWREYDLYEALRRLQSPAASEMCEHVSMADAFKNRLARSKGDLMEVSRRRLGVNYGILPVH